MTVAWNHAATSQVFAVGMNGGAVSSGGGVTWRSTALPAGPSAVSYDPTIRTIYAAAAGRPTRARLSEQ